jgi:hypothetical protein
LGGIKVVAVSVTSSDKEIWGIAIITTTAHSTLANSSKVAGGTTNDLGGTMEASPHTALALALGRRKLRGL